MNGERTKPQSGQGGSLEELISRAFDSRRGETVNMKFLAAVEDDLSADGRQGSVNVIDGRLRIFYVEYGLPTTAIYWVNGREQPS